MTSEVIAHHLRMFGFPSASAAVRNDKLQRGRGLYVAERHADIQRLRTEAHAGAVVVLVNCAATDVERLGGTCTASPVSPPILLHATHGSAGTGLRLRSLHPATHIELPGSETVVETGDGEPVWVWSKVGKGGLLILGTDLSADLIRYRQGDPEKAQSRDLAELYGFAGERPIYLFEQQLEAERPNERYADWWMETLSRALVDLAGATRTSILPAGAPGAIVITGDDDQAQLANYRRQREALGKLPITYFLHPLTKHTKKTLRAMQAEAPVEFGLHPDALDAPENYDALFAEQAGWYELLIGRRARLVRNHGFLNDGYWGHAKTWLRHGATGSSNLPGVDGRVLNGSLLPARLHLDDEMTGHWSILTAIGDGVVFALGWDDARCAACVRGIADDIRRSGVPGIIVLNLHPDNVARTQALHDAAVEVIESGFIAWTLGECLDWFARRDNSPSVTGRGASGRFSKLGRMLASLKDRVS